MYTHIYDLIFKLGLIFLAIIISTQIPFLESMGFAAALVFMVLFMGLYYLYGRTFSTYLYCRFSLKMNLTLEQAKPLNGAFSPVLSLEWLSMKELKNVEDHLKYETTLAIYEAWKART